MQSPEKLIPRDGVVRSAGRGRGRFPRILPASPLTGSPNTPQNYSSPDRKQILPDSTAPSKAFTVEQVAFSEEGNISRSPVKGTQRPPSLYTAGTSERREALAGGDTSLLSIMKAENFGNDDVFNNDGQGNNASPISVTSRSSKHDIKREFREKIRQRSENHSEVGDLEEKLEKMENKFDDMSSLLQEIEEILIRCESDPIQN